MGTQQFSIENSLVLQSQYLFQGDRSKYILMLSKTREGIATTSLCTLLNPRYCKSPTSRTWPWANSTTKLCPGSLRCLTPTSTFLTQAKSSKSPYSSLSPMVLSLWAHQLIKRSTIPSSSHSLKPSLRELYQLRTKLWSQTLLHRSSSNWCPKSSPY